MLDALRNVIDPDFGEDIVACGFVKDLVVDTATGSVSFRLELTTPACPIKEQFEREVGVVGVVGVIGVVGVVGVFGVVGVVFV